MKLISMTQFESGSSVGSDGCPYRSNIAYKSGHTQMKLLFRSCKQHDTIFVTKQKLTEISVTFHPTGKLYRLVQRNLDVLQWLHKPYSEILRNIQNLTRNIEKQKNKCKEKTFRYSSAARFPSSDTEDGCSANLQSKSYLHRKHTHLLTKSFASSQFSGAGTSGMGC